MQVQVRQLYVSQSIHSKELALGAAKQTFVHGPFRRGLFPSEDGVWGEGEHGGDPWGMHRGAGAKQGL